MNVFWQFVICAITGFVIASLSFFIGAYRATGETWKLARSQLKKVLDEELVNCGESRELRLRQLCRNGIIMMKWLDLKKQDRR